MRTVFVFAFLLIFFFASSPAVLFKVSSANADGQSGNLSADPHISFNVSVISPDNETGYIGIVPINFTVDWTVKDAWLLYGENYSYSIDNGPAVNASNQYLIGSNRIAHYAFADVSNLSVGYHALTILVDGRFVFNGSDGGFQEHYDAASAPITFLVQTFPLTVQCLLPQNTTYRNNIPLIFTINEPVSWVGYSLDNQANTTIFGNTTLTGLSNGSNNLTLYAFDAAGNIGKSGTVLFAIDTSTPSPIPTQSLSPSPSLGPIKSSTSPLSPSPTLTLSPIITPTESSTQNPTIEPSATPNNTQENFISITIIAGLAIVIVAFVILLPVYLRRTKKQK